MRLRPPVVAGLVLAALLAGGCSSDAAEAPVTAATIETAPNTSAPSSTAVSVTVVAVATTAPPTTSTTTLVATTTAAPPTTSTTTPVTTSDSATTAMPVVATSAPSAAVAPGTSLPASADYTAVAGPAVGDQTTAIDPAWLGPDGVTLTTVADGTYWATLAGEGDSPQRFVNFKLTQAFFGAACTARFGGDSCDNDLATLETPTGAFPLYLGTARITVADAVTQQSFQVTGDELFGLVGGKPPSAAAPAAFTYVPFAFLLTVGGGQIVSAEQVWTP